jgi:hypothetical protein
VTVHKHPRLCPLNAPGPFYTMETCLACGAPEAEAPELLAPLTGGNCTTYFVRQPVTPAEIERACNAIRVCCVMDLRYGGTDRAIIEQLGNDPLTCDYIIRDGQLVLGESAEAGAAVDLISAWPTPSESPPKSEQTVDCHGKDRLAKRWKWWGIVARVAVVAVVVLAVRWVWFPGRAFNSVVWQDAVQVRQGVRLEMADRLVARGTLIGKSRAMVVELLGEPPPTGYFADWDLVYWLGPERGFISIDSEWLVLRLDADGRVTENRIVRD